MSPHPFFLIIVDDNPMRIGVIARTVHECSHIRYFNMRPTVPHLLRFFDTPMAPPINLVLVNLRTALGNPGSVIQNLRRYQRMNHMHIIALKTALTHDDLSELAALGFDGAIGLSRTPEDILPPFLRILAGEAVWNPSPVAGTGPT